MATFSLSSALHGWHPGERDIQRKLGFDKAPGIDQAWQYIYGELTEQQRTFHTSNLHFLPVVTLDTKGRPWSSILAGETGDIGWIKPAGGGYQVLQLKPQVSAGDPFWENAEQLAKGDGDRALIAGIGVEVSTRRRNKLAGRVVNLTRNDDRTVDMDVEVNESTGNCPKYIVVRSVAPHPNVQPTIIHDNVDMAATDRLPSDVISFIQAADTVWLGTAYFPDPSSPQSRIYPSHLGMNHRGGRPGWVRVIPSDGRTVVLPDFSGNRFMSSLGNIEATPVASLVIADFKTGDILYLTGGAKNLVGESAENIMPMQKVLTTLHVTGYRFVKDSLPVRQKPLSASEEVELSPYSPPVKLLREEIEARGGVAKYFAGDSNPTATLEKIEIHSPTIATFTFASSEALQIRPGQAMILDFKSLLGSPQYRHMSNHKPSLVNDDLIRTWTVSSYHPPAGPGRDDSGKGASFTLTMKEKEGGVVTGALFQIARKLKEKRPELLQDTAPLEIKPRIVGVAGEFYLDLEGGRSEPQERKFVWGAGGIGFTPFVSMLKALDHEVGSSVGKVWDIVFLLSTREPAVLIPLVEEAFRSGSNQETNSNIRLQLHVFTSKEFNLGKETPFEVQVHRGRLGEDWFKEEKELLQGREGYVCGPLEFENLVIHSLANVVGLGKRNVRRETFAY